MPCLSRRSFLATSAAVAATPALGALRPSDRLDVAVIGAGAAGIAAGRRFAAAKRSFVIVEAVDRVGGRCLTDTEIFGVPYDLGAHWIHMPDLNPVSKLAASTGLNVYSAPPGERVRIGRRYARPGEMEDFLSALVRSNRAISEQARGKVDVPCAQALPKDLLDWRSTVGFVLGPFGCGKDLTEVSAVDFAKSVERDVDAFCRQGFGALIANLAEGLPIQLSNPVKRIEYSRRGVEIATAKGYINARTAIITASTGVLAADKIKFDPDLPNRYLEAANKLALGSYDHIALELPGNPLGLQRDDLLFEKADSSRTGAILGNIAGTPLTMVDVGGTFGRELSAQGAEAMVDFAVNWLGNLYGADLKKAVKRSHATRWNDEPWTLGAFSVASVGGQGSRRVLMEPVRERLWFAGEAAHETLWGTVGG
ncbi:MAG: FAD-dependent oxidoreductase, partial [Bradyrhizobiaceae bacterium]|nr:FAD-dependent oxidoreductase [Bradyrhizobiaceae bacterium]